MKRRLCEPLPRATPAGGRRDHDVKCDPRSVGIATRNRTTTDSAQPNSAVSRPRRDGESFGAQH